MKSFLFLLFSIGMALTCSFQTDVGATPNSPNTTTIPEFVIPPITTKTQLDEPVEKPPCKHRSKDRHIKVNGRDRRVRLRKECAARISKLKEDLNLKTNGQAIEWLLKQSQPEVRAATGRGASPTRASTSAGPRQLPQPSTTASVSSSTMHGEAADCLVFDPAELYFSDLGDILDLAPLDPIPGLLPLGFGPI